MLFRSVVVPCGKLEPDGGLQSEIAAWQPSLSSGAGKLTTARPKPGELSFTVIFDGQTMVGGCGSCTVTAKTQGPPVSPRQITFVVPSGKTEPDGGMQATVPHSLPAPLAAKVTAAPHCPGAFCVTMSDGQVTSQVCGVPSGMVTEAVNVLSVANNSLVKLETVAVLETTAPGDAPGST